MTFRCSLGDWRSASGIPVLFPVLCWWLEAPVPCVTALAGATWCPGSAVTSPPSVQNNSVLLLITSQKVVNAAFLNLSHFEASFEVLLLSCLPANTHPAQPFFGVCISGVQGRELQGLCPFLSCSWVAVTSQKLLPVRGSGVECDGWAPDVTETPDLIFAEFWGSGALARKERVFPTLDNVPSLLQLRQPNAAGWILSS